MNQLTKKIVVSGIRATGRMHLGNFFGAVQNFVPLQETHQCFFFVADYHTLTSLRDPNDLRANLPEIVKDYLAAGLDPQKSTIFAQSSVPKISELSLLLSMVTSVGELQRCPTFKEKVATQPDNVNLGLFGYPVLMAADILIQKSNIVPVGKDQLPHIEMARTIAGRFNNRYGDTFPLPEALEHKAIRIPGIDGAEKMGKSHGNTINLHDSAEDIRSKVMNAVTDTTRIRRSDPGHPDKCSVFALHGFTSSPDMVAQIEHDCQNGGVGCVDCKKILCQSLTDFVTPFQERRSTIGDSEVRQVLYYGGKFARRMADNTIQEVREKMGLHHY